MRDRYMALCARTFDSAHVQILAAVALYCEEAGRPDVAQHLIEMAERLADDPFASLRQEDTAA